MSLKWSKREVANYIYGFFNSHINFFVNWGCYLFNPEFSKDIELRNKVFCLYLCALLDSLDGRDTLLKNLENHSKEFKSQKFLHYCRGIGKFGRLIEELLRVFTKEEQILMRDFRNTLVHGWLTGTMQSVVKVIYFDGKKLRKEKIGHLDYHKIIASVHPADTTFNEVLTTLFNKLIGENCAYWPAMKHLLDTQTTAGLHDDIYGELAEEDYLSNE